MGCGQSLLGTSKSAEEAVVIGRQDVPSSSTIVSVIHRSWAIPIFDSAKLAALDSAIIGQRQPQNFHFKVIWVMDTVWILCKTPNVVLHSTTRYFACTLY